MAKHSRGRDGLEAALAVYLGIYCTVAACFALGLYTLMQPTRHPNSGLAAYKPPPAMVVSYLPSFRNGDPRSVAAADAVVAQTDTEKARTAKAEASGQEARAEAFKRQRTASTPRERREPRWQDPRWQEQRWQESRWRYAQQPFYGGGNRPWF
jgi:hypothetical protein